MDRVKYEIKCRKCGHIQEMTYPGKTAQARAAIMEKMNTAQYELCDGCRNFTVFDIVAF